MKEVAVLIIFANIEISVSLIVCYDFCLKIPLVPKCSKHLACCEANFKKGRKENIKKINLLTFQFQGAMQKLCLKRRNHQIFSNFMHRYFINGYSVIACTCNIATEQILIVYLFLKFQWKLQTNQVYRTDIPVSGIMTTRSDQTCNYFYHLEMEILSPWLISIL